MKKVSVQFNLEIHDELQPGDIVLKVYTDTRESGMYSYAFYVVKKSTTNEKLYYGRSGRGIKLYKVPKEFVVKRALQYSYTQVRLISNA